MAETSKKPSGNNPTFFLILGAVIMVSIAIGFYIISGKDTGSPDNISSGSDIQKTGPREMQLRTPIAQGVPRESNIIRNEGADENSLSYILSEARLTEKLGVRLEEIGFTVRVDDNYKEFIAVRLSPNGNCQIEETVTWVNGFNNTVRSVNKQTRNVCN